VHPAGPLSHAYCNYSAPVLSWDSSKPQEKIRVVSVLFTALLLIAAPVALADGNSTLTLTSPGSNVRGGVYVGPYTLTVNSGGQSSQLELVCDDFKDEIFPGES
jgi:hypothetical protein